MEVTSETTSSDMHVLNIMFPLLLVGYVGNLLDSSWLCLICDVLDIPVLQRLRSLPDILCGTRVRMAGTRLLHRVCTAWDRQYVYYILYLL